MMPQLDLNFIYLKVVKLDGIYFITKHHFQINALILRKLKN